MTFLTQAQRKQLQANGRAQQAAQASGNDDLDVAPVVKLFTPDANCTWLLTELDADGELAFGLCDLGLGFPELGYVSLAELASVRGPLGLRVELDDSFVADKTLGLYAAEARRHRRIVA